MNPKAPKPELFHFLYGIDMLNLQLPLAKNAISG